jgi:class 3 adenylate cyclase/tetratricopeptide (TPR) repeat protein
MRCPTCRTDNPAESKFCSECGTDLRKSLQANQPGGSPPEEERRLTTILFADLAGFTSMSEGMDPEAVKALAAHCAVVMSEEVRRFGGVVSTVLGDAVMALFGAPVAHEDDPERAVRAAVSMRDRIASVQGAPKQLELHVGINTGETIAGMIGPEEARDYTAMGDTTNTAARLMAAAPAGSVYVGEKTFLSTQDAVTYGEIGPVVAKGKSLSVRAWEVLGLSPVPSTRSLGTTPLVGREMELRALRELWNGVVRERSPAIGLVLAPPGFGKSRLLREFTAGLHGARRVRTGRCLSYGEGITYWPVVEILKEAIGILHGDDTATVSKKIARFLDAFSSADSDQRQTLRSCLNTLIATRSADMEAEITQGELHWGIRRILELLADEGPIALVVEDVHWAEPTLLELLDHVVRAAGGPILLLATARPEIEDSWPGGLTEGAGRRTIRLPALTEHESDQVLASLMPGSHLIEGSVADVLRRAAGVPLFLEETVRMLADMGAPDSSGLAPGDGAQSMPVPSSLQGLIGSRLDLLPAKDKLLAQFASVVGSTFWAGAIAHMRGTKEGLVESLDRLGEKDVVSAREPSSIAGEREFAFVHALIRDVAYDRLPKLRRSELHVRCSEWISSLPAGDESFTEIVAFHLETACKLARELGPSVPAPVSQAVGALTRAAEKAERREGIVEADRFYARALELMDGGLDERSSELRLRRSRTLTALGRLGDARRLLDAVMRDSRPLDRLDLRGAALVGLANIDLKQGRVSDARERLDEAQAIGADLADVRLQIRAAYELSSLRSDYAGEFEAAARGLTGAQNLAEGLGDRPLRVEGHLRMGTLLFNLGQLVQAEEEFLRCLALARDTGSVRDDARATHFLGLVKYYLGEYEEAERNALRTAEWLERTSDRYLQTQNLRLLGKLALAEGDNQLARDRLQEALGLALESGTPWLVVEVYRYLTEVLLRQGRLTEAREAALAAAESLPEEDQYARSAVLLAQALVAGAEGARDTAIGKFEEALPVLEEQRLMTDLAEARIEFARVLRGFGDVERAERELELAREGLAGTDARGLRSSIDRVLTSFDGGASRPTEVGSS